jgi:hypothetical protein
MKLAITSKEIGNIAEIWTYGEQELKVITKAGRTIKVIAARNIYSGSSYKYNALFEEQVTLEVAGVLRTLWISLPLSAPGGETIEHCMENALQFINDEINNHTYVA